MPVCFLEVTRDEEVQCWGVLDGELLGKDVLELSASSVVFWEHSTFQALEKQTQRLPDDL